MPGKEDSKTSLNQYVCYCQRTERRAMWLKEIIERNSKSISPLETQCNNRHTGGFKLQLESSKTKDEISMNNILSRR